MTTEQTLFLGFVAGMFAVAVSIAGRYLGPRVAAGGAVALAAWFAYVGLLAHSGVLRQADARPPGTAYLLGPVVAYLLVVVAVVARGRARWARAFPLWLLVGTQGFRVGVELFIHRLWLDGVVPQTLTYSGANVDLYIGATAPVVAWLSTLGGWGRRVALAWNVLGLLALANVVSRAILTVPGPLNVIHADPPNRMFGTFPFMFIPAFFVPLAVTLHAVALRSLADRHDTVLREPDADGAGPRLEGESYP